MEKQCNTNTMSSYPTIQVNIKPEILLEEIEGEAVLLSLETERYFGLDPIGLLIWRTLEKNPISDVAVKAVLAEYDADEKTAYNDVAAFIVKLEQAGLLSAESASV